MLETYRLKRLCSGIAALSLLRSGLAAGDVRIVRGFLVVRHDGGRVYGTLTSTESCLE